MKIGESSGRLKKSSGRQNEQVSSTKNARRTYPSGIFANDQGVKSSLSFPSTSDRLALKD